MIESSSSLAPIESTTLYSGFNLFNIGSNHFGKTPGFQTPQMKPRLGVCSPNQTIRISSFGGTLTRRKQASPDGSPNKINSQVAQGHGNASFEYMQEAKPKLSKSGAHPPFEKSKSYAAIFPNQKKKAECSSSRLIFGAKNKIFVRQHSHRSKIDKIDQKPKEVSEKSQLGPIPITPTTLNKKIEERKEQVLTKFESRPSLKNSFRTTQDASGKSTNPDTTEKSQHKKTLSFVSPEKCSKDLIIKMEGFSEKLHTFLAKNAKKKA